MIVIAGSTAFPILKFRIENIGGDIEDRYSNQGPRSSITSGWDARWRTMPKVGVTEMILLQLMGYIDVVL